MIAKRLWEYETNPLKPHIGSSSTENVKLVSTRETRDTIVSLLDTDGVRATSGFPLAGIHHSLALLLTTNNIIVLKISLALEKIH
jgi:hypothetical protein